MTNISKIFRGIAGQLKTFDIRSFSLKGLDRSKLLVPFGLIRHPIETFNDMKYEGRSSLGVANLILFVYFLEEMLNFTLTGYLFTNNSSEDLSIIAVFAKTVLLVLLWTVCNWATCTLLEGEGTFKQIWIATCYSLIPLVIMSLPISLVSNFFSVSEASFYNTFTLIMQGWFIILLFLGMMVTHQFTAAKTFGSAVLTLAMIAIAAFFVLLFVSIAQQLMAFLNTIFTELSIR
ncbi:MAG: YIP1 family protein [Clostridia bacterium]|nr:YIP1 family protein [Clostridia bacterium]